DLVSASSLPPREAAIAGEDAASLGAAGASPVNGSDVLMLRFMESADGVMLNCGGFPVIEPDVDGKYAGQSIFFVGTDSAGEPELRCRYYRNGKAGTDALAPGIESFQVLYGQD